jgi:hypothetical protein
VLRNKTSTIALANYTEAATQLSQKRNEHKQIKKRIEKCETDSFSLKEELVVY